MIRFLFSLKVERELIKKNAQTELLKEELNAEKKVIRELEKRLGEIEVELVSDAR